MKSILIAVPTYESIESQTLKSIWNLKRPEGYNVDFDYVSGHGIEHARNLIVRKAIENSYDYVFMVDSDMVLPSEALVMLLSTGKDFISGWYVGRSGRGITTCVINRNNPKELAEIENIHGSEAFPIWATGFGCVLISTFLFPLVSKNNWFKFEKFRFSGWSCEDHSFCEKAQNKGIPVYLHSLVRCGHIKKIVV